jgi:hypothetical protein
VRNPQPNQSRQHQGRQPKTQQLLFKPAGEVSELARSLKSYQTKPKRKVTDAYIIIKYNCYQNMASKYLQKYPVPDGFQEILHDLTREVKLPLHA